MRRIRRKIDELGPPDAAKEVTSYEETIELPFVKRTIALTPEVKSPL